MPQLLFLSSRRSRGIVGWEGVRGGGCVRCKGRRLLTPLRRSDVNRASTATEPNGGGWWWRHEQTSFPSSKANASFPFFSSSFPPWHAPLHSGRTIKQRRGRVMFNEQPADPHHTLLPTTNTAPFVSEKENKNESDLQTGPGNKTCDD